MDKKNTRILTSIVAIIAIGFILDFLSKVSDKGGPTTFGSMTIDEAKKEGYFLTEYRPLIKKIKLNNHSDSVEFFRLWTEKERDIKKIWIFHRTILSGRTIFKIDYRQYPSDEFNFQNFQITGYGGHGGRGTISKDFSVDTVIFQIVEKSPIDTLGWREQLPGQLIKFIKD